MMNNSKTSTHPLFNPFEVLTSTSDKGDFFARKFCSNTIIYSSGELTPDFPTITEALLIDMRITTSLVSDIMSKLDPHKTNGADVIASIVLKIYVHI